MIVMIGYIVVLAGVFGGFILSGGHVAALIQPFELLMIGGAAIGAFITSNSLTVIKATIKVIPSAFKGAKFNKAIYVELLSLLYTILNKMKKEGPLSIEADIEKPFESELFKQYPKLSKEHHIIEFITDYMRLMISGNLDPFQIENLMDNELETHHREMAQPINALSKLADGLPAFGIVAAVMGVVHTMESIGLPPEQLGELIARALVGTFLGILLGYGFISPLATALEHKATNSSKVFQCIKVTLLANMHGYNPQVAVEFGRKVLYSTERPSSSELETVVKELKAK